MLSKDETRFIDTVRHHMFDTGSNIQDYLMFGGFGDVNPTKTDSSTFTSLMISPLCLGAHIVVHSLTRFIIGTSDRVAVCVCSTKSFIDIERP
jgi:hypothetical protein